MEEATHFVWPTCRYASALLYFDGLNVALMNFPVFYKNDLNLSIVFVTLKIDNDRIHHLDFGKRFQSDMELVWVSENSGVLARLRD